MQPELPPEHSALPKLSLWQRAKSLGRRIAGFCSRWWSILKPTREVRRGAYITVILFVPLWWAIFGAPDSRFFGL
ncbi:MAG: hypothetical protein HY235_22775, partial [Acidobacteria bacterium]|nr:hypothetical protein [Acidobacteriota bacterium]